MDDPKVNGLDKISDEQLEAFSGGYILDLCGYNNREQYALVSDKDGKFYCFANSVKGIKENLDYINYYGVSGDTITDRIITVEEYEQLFGESPL